MERRDEAYLAAGARRARPRGVRGGRHGKRRTAPARTSRRSRSSSVELVERVGSYVGLAAFLGLAVLALLYFSQARDVRRLRDWAGRAPERAVEQTERAAEVERATEVAPATPARRDRGAHSLPPTPLSQASQPRKRKPLRERIRNIHIPQLRYIAMAVAGRAGARRAPRTARSSSPDDDGGTPSRPRPAASASGTAPASGDRRAPAAPTSTRAGDRRGAERHHGAGPGGAGRRGGARRRLHARDDRQRRADRPDRLRGAVPRRPGSARRAPSPTGSGSTRPAPVDSVNEEIAGSFDVVVLVGSDRRWVGRRSAATGGRRRVAVFAALVVATVGAFFVTTRLKRSTPVIEQLTFRRSFSPNGDGRFDAALFAFRLRRTDEVTVSIVNRDGDEVRTLARGRAAAAAAAATAFAGTAAPTPGGWRRTASTTSGSGCAARAARSPRRASCSSTRVPPRPVVRYVSPDSISPDGAGGANSATLRFAGPVAARAAARLPDRPAPARAWSPRGAIPRDESTVRWDGRVTGGAARRRRGRTCWSCARRTRPATSGRRGCRRAAAAVRGHPGAGGALRRRRMRPRRSSSRGSGPRSRSRRTAAGTGGACGGSARAGSLDARLAADRARSRCRCASRPLRGRVLTVRVGLAPLHDAVRRAGPRGASGCWSCCRTPPGRRATGSRRTATATRTCCRRTRG